MITGVIIGVVLLAGLAFAIYKMETAPTFEQAFPNYHPQCSDCNKGGDACPTCPFRDKDYTPNTSWASGQDDVPPAPEGIHVLSEGKASKLYIEAKEKDINDGLEVLNALIKSLDVDDNITPIQLDIIKSSLHDIKSCMMRALI